jgi:hypothetical protein
LGRIGFNFLRVLKFMLTGLRQYRPNPLMEGFAIIVTPTIVLLLMELNVDNTIRTFVMMPYVVNTMSPYRLLTNMLEVIRQVLHSSTERVKQPRTIEFRIECPLLNLPFQFVSIAAERF